MQRVRTRVNRVLKQLKRRCFTLNDPQYCELWHRHIDAVISQSTQLSYEFCCIILILMHYVYKLAVRHSFETAFRKLEYC